MLYRFGICVLDLARTSLRAADQRVDLRPKCFDALRYLVENAGRLITKDELIRAVWPNVVVTDASLTRCISDVRAAIGDHDQKIIETIPRRGYIFTAPVSQQGSIDLPAKASVAVLPFDNMSDAKEQEYFADGIVEDITTELSRFSELLVIARNSSFQYKGRAVDARQVGRELGVRYVLEGSIRRAGKRVRISAQLVEAQTGTHRWAERYDRRLEDVFGVQDEVARTIAALLAAQVNKAEFERTLLKPPATWEAYDFYMRAAAFANTFQSSAKVENLYEARRLLERSLLIDPNYARTHVMLSFSYFIAYALPSDADYLNPATLERARQLAVKAIQLDPGLPEAHAQLGRVLTWCREHDAGIAEFERATALNPNFSDQGFVAALQFAGEFERAIEVGKARMRLDPFHSPFAPGWLGLTYYMLKLYAQALPLLRECVSRAPDLRAGHVWLAATYVRLGYLEKARAEAAEVLRVEPNYSINGVQRRLSNYKAQQHAEHLFDALRRAGLPEN